MYRKITIGETIIGAILFFGAGAIALMILVYATCRARSMLTGVLWGLLAACLMLLQCSMFLAAVSVNPDLGKEHARFYAENTGWFFFICLGIYVIVMPRKLRERRNNYGG